MLIKDCMDSLLQTSGSINLAQLANVLLAFFSIWPQINVHSDMTEHKFNSDDTEAYNMIWK